MSMNKWLAVAAIGVLAVALVVVIVVFSNQAGKLNRDLDEAELRMTTLQGQANSLQSNVTSLQGQLSQEKNTVSSLQADLSSTRGQVSTLQGNVTSQQATISQRDSQIATMKYPRFFNSQIELSNWLQKDNTNTLYANPNAVEKAVMAFVLQIRATRDGYILPVSLPIGGSLEVLSNRAIIGDIMYDVRAWDDFVQRGIAVSPAMPSYPITPESGQ
jgi:uncharacterized protein YoxC